MPGPLDLPEIDAVVLEMPSSNGPYGMKGVGEMTANPPIPAIVNAVTDAIGVQICDLPITPEKVLRASGIQGGRVVLKVFSLIKRREDLSLDEFREWVFEKHAPMGKELPGLREYHVSVVEQDDPDLPYHAGDRALLRRRGRLQGRLRERRRPRGAATTWPGTRRGGCAC